MRAGQHHRVDLVAALLEHQPRDLARHRIDRDGLAAQLGLGQRDQPVGAVAQQRLALRKLALELVDIGLAHGRLGAEQAEGARPGERGGGLDGGHGADDRSFQHLADHAERDGAGGVARQTDQPRLVAFGHPSE